MGRQTDVLRRKGTARQEAFFRAVLVGILLGGLILLGFLLRWQYAVSSSPFWDEFITLWSARNITRGVASPFQWGPGADAPLTRNLEALILRSFGFNVTIARLPSIIISVLAIPVTFYTGKRMFSVPAGLLAAALMASAPQVVIEGARARPYPLFLLLTLLSVLSFYGWMIESDDDIVKSHSQGWPFVVCFVAAVFTHLEAILLLPAFALSAWLRRGRRILTRKWVLVDFLLCGVAAIVALVLFVQGENPPGAIALNQGVWAGSATIELGLKNLEVFNKLLRRTPGGFVLLSIALGGLGYLAVGTLWTKLSVGSSSSGRARGAKERADVVSAVALDRQRHALVFLAVLLLWVTGVIVLVMGPRWGSETRYLLFLFPMFSLVAAGISVRFLSFVVERIGLQGRVVQQWALIGLVVVGAGLFTASSMVDKQRFQQEWGYDLAFEYVADRWREGDVTATVAPMACLVSLQECDYVAIQRAYETYAIEKDGRLVEAVTRLPLIMTVQEMQQVLDEHDRVWFVTDEGRLISRYDTDFVQLIWDKMELVANERGALVFRSLRQGQPSIRHLMDWNFEDKFRLRSCDLNRRTAAPGEELELTLYWQGVEYASYFGLDYSVFVHLVDREGRLWAQSDSYPVRDLYPTSHWRSTEVVIPDRRTILLPAGTPPDRYRLEAGMYLLSTGDRLEVWDESGGPIGDKLILDYVKVGEGNDNHLEPSNALQANLGDEIELLGYDLFRSTSELGGSLKLTLYWRALGDAKQNYSAFVHLVGQDGRIVSQHDGQPEGGFYPTSYWDPGEVVRDDHVLSLPSGVEAEEYELRVGMYLLEDMHRLPVEGRGVDGDWVVLTTIRLPDNVDIGGS